MGCLEKKGNYYALPTKHPVIAFNNRIQFNLRIAETIEGQPLQIWQCSETHALNGEIMLQWPSHLASMHFMLFLQIYIHLADKHDVISENLENVCFISPETVLLPPRNTLFKISTCISYSNMHVETTTLKKTLYSEFLSKISCLQCVVLTNFVDLSGWKTCSQVGKQFY